MNIRYISEKEEGACQPVREATPESATETPAGRDEAMEVAECVDS